MSLKKQLSILEFSRLTGIKRDNLRFYDKIGLLKPEMRGENGYRYYTRRQLGAAYLIVNLRLLGVGLEDIKLYSADRNPEKMLALFARQEERMRAEMTKLEEMSDMMRLYADMACQALGKRAGTFFVEECKRERIFLCPPAPKGMSMEEASIIAYDYADRQGLNLGYPAGVLTTAKSNQDWEYRYYFRTGKHGNAWKPEGQYAIAYGTGDEEQSEELYWRLCAFAKEQGLEATGGAYMELLLDELCVQEAGQFLSRVEILVKRA